jgi:hypothetical protein
MAVNAARGSSPAAGRFVFVECQENRWNMGFLKVLPCKIIPLLA